MKFVRPHLLMLPLALLALSSLVRGDVAAQGRIKPLSQQEQEDLDNLSSQRRADDRKVDASRQTARQIAQEIEDLRNQIIDISKKQGTSETRAAIYRAKLETLNLQEADITRRLSAMRSKESRLLSALQIYSRNPPPAIFISTQRANDAVVAAILMRAITPELQQRTQVLAQQNAQLINLRRQAALQNEALFISESDVSEQRSEIEKLVAQKSALEDQILNQADQLEAQSAALKAREDRLRGNLPLHGLFGLAPGEDATHLLPPVVGDKTGDFGQTNDGPVRRGVSFSAQPGAQVTSPAEGEIEFVGPLDSYGQIVIINIGHDMRVVLTGLGRVYVDKGKTVGRHEPIGRMPNLSDKTTTLYMELRKGEEPVNPSTSIQVSTN